MLAEHDRASVERRRRSQHAQHHSKDGGGERVLQFSVETATDALNDLELRVVPLPSNTQHAASSTSPASPATPRGPTARWIRRRVLTEHDEIVDQVFDTASRRLCWSVHRPVRGWYVHLRSPQMPAGASLSLHPPPQATQEPGSTPLALSLHTRIRQAALSQLTPFIALVETSTKPPPVLTTLSQDFTTVNLDSHTYPPPIAAAGHTGDISADEGAHPEEVARTTGVDSAQSQQKTHTRRRSAGTSSSQHTSKRSVSAPSQTPVVAEEGEEWVAPQHQQRDNAQTYHGKPASLASVASSATINEPHQCSILLTDAQHPGMPADTGDAAAQQSSGGWARQAWKLLPAPARPLLRLDSSKSFSIYWTDMPSLSDCTAQSIEVVRFLDESSWWQWKGKRLGRLLLQQRAIEALNLDTATWIALALAYLEYLEERDGYNAVAEG